MGFACGDAAYRTTYILCCSSTRRTGAASRPNKLRARGLGRLLTMLAGIGRGLGRRSVLGSSERDDEAANALMSGDMTDHVR